MILVTVEPSGALVRVLADAEGLDDLELKMDELRAGRTGGAAIEVQPYTAARPRVTLQLRDMTGYAG